MRKVLCERAWSPRASRSIRATASSASVFASADMPRLTRPRTSAPSCASPDLGGHTGASSHIWQVIEWAKTTRGGRQYDLLADVTPATACASAYGLCE